MSTLHQIRCELAAIREELDGLTAPELTTTTVSFCRPVGWVNVNPDGTIAAECGGVTASRAAVGRYDLTPPAEAATAMATVVEQENTRDSIEIHPTDFLATRVHITEGDNGAAANTFRDRPFMVVWFGPSAAVVETVTLT